MGNLTCCKYLMFLFNLLIFIGGAVLVGTGIWITVDGSSFKSIISVDPALFNAVYLLIAVGAVIFVTGFLGCCGAIKESKCLLNTFFVLVLVLFIVELAAIILGFVNNSKLEEIIKESMTLYGSNEVVRDGWDTLQSGFDCCGYNSPADWVESGFNAVVGGLPITYPSSCGNVLLVAAKPGCKRILTGYFIVIAGAAIAVLFVELLAMIFACCLSRNVGKDRYA